MFAVELENNERYSRYLSSLSFSGESVQLAAQEPEAEGGDGH